MKSFLLIIIGSLFFTACTSDAVNIQDLNRQFIDAWNTKNADKIAGYLAEDVDFVQGNTHFKGKSEVSKKWVQETLPTLSDLKTNVVSSGIDKKTAYEAGTFSVDVLPASPDLPHGIGEGNFILLWKKGDDGTWKLSYAQLEDMPVQAKN
ncbi:nuclear transport factor 2 family protein [Spirosoma aureum]|uniref:Nuclear transport factor 2 family protein n=1 Tax=Spirosoma aureum TaxID=2692134 RepID=A0A6G9APV9_9BACT|nr:nuclear transport factor 2 family protein [Spirosoma aureum]QIP14408.1 nuclear transport factor 2 family protein [Spirosoma aureum]